MATKIEFSDKAKAEMGTTAANEIAGGFNKVLMAIEQMDSRVGKLESRLWTVMTTVVIGALGMILGAGAMIYAAIQLMSL